MRTIESHIFIYTGTAGLRKFYVDFSRFSCTDSFFAVSLQRFKNGGSPLRESIGKLLGISSAGFFYAPWPSGKAGDEKPGSFPRGRNSLPSLEKNIFPVGEKTFSRDHFYKSSYGGCHSVNFDMLFGDVTVLKPTGCAAAFSVLGSLTDRYG